MTALVGAGLRLSDYQRKAYIRATRYSSSEPAIGQQEVRLKMSRWVVRSTLVGANGVFTMPDGSIPLNAINNPPTKNPTLVYYAEPIEE